MAFKAETWDETIKLLEWKNLYLVKLKKELTQPIQQLFRPVHITHVLRMCLRQGVASQQGDGKFPISVLTQSTVENADCCV